MSCDFKISFALHWTLRMLKVVYQVLDKFEETEGSPTTPREGRVFQVPACPQQYGTQDMSGSGPWFSYV